MSKPVEDFFIGWEATPAPSIRAFVRRCTLILLCIAVVVAGVVAALQQTISTGQFDFGNEQEFSGVLVAGAAPMLVSDEAIEGERIFYLVSTFKYGFPKEVADANHLKKVSLQGTLIGDGLESMIEVVAGSVSASEQTTSNPLAAAPMMAFRIETIRGEIVDSKCHLGVMNPGRFKPHRACAIRCISGGIPPILVARNREGRLAHYLLVGPDGAAINDAVLDYVAEPVEITGELKKAGDRVVFYIDPATIKRL